MNITDRDTAIVMLLSGKVGVLPTDTLYGLVARAADSGAVARLYGLKHREHKPGTLIAASTDQLIALGLKESIVNKVAHLWPNPLSIVLEAEGMDYLDQGVHGLAVRVVSDATTKELLSKTGPLMTSSANMPGEPAATTLAMAEGYFGDSVDFYVDGGDLSSRSPSSVIGFDGGQLKIFRVGALSEKELLRLGVM